MATIMGADEAPSTRTVIFRTKGRRHGPITRLMSPGDLGQHLKPFVFLDLFQGNLLRGGGMGLHPHSGIGTVTVLVEGDMTFDDGIDGRGAIDYGGVEWMRAGGGVWHGKELSPGKSENTTGFQLWIALPPELENSEPQSQYLESSAIPDLAPARLIVGSYGGVQSPIKAPAGLNYLLVTLAAGENWTYAPPEGHKVAWIAVATGQLAGATPVATGELAVLDDSAASVVLTGGPSGAKFVLGSAIPFPHNLHLGYYSVHTSAPALAAGERRIQELSRAFR